MNPKTGNLRRAAALYARVSTREGKQHLDNQLHTLRQFAAGHAWEIVAEFTDQESGAREQRPGLDEMMKQAARGRFDIVLVFDLSRLTRGGIAKAFHFIERLSANKVEFWSAQEEYFRSAGPFGQVFIAIAAHIAQAERAMLQARIRAGIDRAKREGKETGRPRVVVDRSKIQALADAGKSIRAIAAELQLSKTTVSRALTDDTAKMQARMKALEVLATGRVPEPETPAAGICDACEMEGGTQKLPGRYHGLDCPRRPRGRRK